MRHLLAIILVLSAAQDALAATYYIASGTGGGVTCSDSNAGTLKTAPWCHAPGMAAATGTAAAHVTAAGDQYVLRGGDTWTFSGGWGIDNGGCAGTSSGNRVHVGGLDQTWYAGGSFYRPILSGGGTWPGASTTYPSALLGVDYCPYTEVAFIEFTGYYVNQASTNIGIFTCNNGSTCHGVLLHDNYFHGWKYGASAATSDEMFITYWNGSANSDSSAYNNVFDGSDATIPTCLNGAEVICRGGGAFANGPATIYDNYISHVANAMNLGLSGSFNIHDNNIPDIHCDYDNLTHGNVLQNTGGITGTSYYYNNRAVSYGACAFGLNPHLASSATLYLFNNIYGDGNTVGGGGLSLSGNGTGQTGTTIYAFNNTIEPESDSGSGPSTACFIVDAGQSFTNNIYNNHCISSTGAITSNSGSGGSPTINTLTNLIQSKTVANANSATAFNQYALSQTFAFSPVASTNSTVGAGTNENSLCSGMADGTAQAACQSDSTAGVGEATGLGGYIVSIPARNANSRPSGAWDVGAYQYQSSAPAPCGSCFASLDTEGQWTLAWKRFLRNQSGIDVLAYTVWRGAEEDRCGELQEPDVHGHQAGLVITTQ